jgi:CheY-like chemotaxis protein
MMSERKPRVLGVDDSLTIRKALEIVLKPAGYDLELAVDGADALAKARSFKPDVILLDFILPDMRGSEVCQQLALDPETAHIPVILVSAKGAEIRQAYRDAHNVVSYIAKPFKPQVVTGIVAEVLAKTAAGEQVKAAVPVHEAEGLSIPPVAPVAPVAPTPPPPSWTSEQAPPPTPTPPPVATPPEPVAPPLAAEPLAPPARVAPRPRPAPRRPLPSLPLAEGMRVEAHSPFASEAARREALDLMFETLRSSTEGVYVEEVDTPLGAAADQAKSYIEILEALVRELGEGLEHARSGARYRLYGDGSVRSFDESLHEIFRRACRLVFRATSAGALGHDSTVQRPRVLVVCSKGGTVHRQLPALVAAHPDWQVFQVTEGFRQLPMVVRLFGPTVVLAEVTWSGALWEQLAVAARLPELQNARVIGVATAERTPPAAVEDPRAREEALGVRAIRVVAQSLFEAEHILAEDRSPSQQEAMAEPIAGPSNEFETAEPSPTLGGESLSAS